MMQVNRIDMTTGLFIEPIALEDGVTLTEAVTDANGNVTYQPRADIITVSVPEGFHQPKWDSVNKKWIEGKSDADLLQIAKDVKSAELDSKYNQATAMVQSSALGTSHTYVIRNGGSDYSTFFNAKFAFVQTTYYDGSSFNWFTVEAGDVLHTKDQFCQAWTDIEKFTETARGKRKTFQTNISGCTSIADVNAIAITF